MTKNVKRDLIRRAAQEVMLRYGFERTTMDDIAKTAGISRPALYLSYKNKIEIYRDVCQDVTTQCIVKANIEAEKTGSLAKRLLAVLNAAFLDVLEDVTEYPHGAELVNLKDSLAADLSATWRKATLKALTRAIPKGPGLSSESLAMHLLDAIDGAKSRTTDIKEIRKATMLAIDVVSRLRT